MEPPCDRLSVPTPGRVGFHRSEERLADGFYIDRSRRQQTDFIAAKVRIPGLPELFDPQGVNSALPPSFSTAKSHQWRIGGGGRLCCHRQKLTCTAVHHHQRIHRLRCYGIL